MRFRFLLLAAAVITMAGLAVSGPAKAESYPDCNLSSTFTAYLKDSAGKGIKGLKIEVYEEDFENNYDQNPPLVGKKILSGTTDANGKFTTTSFRPRINKRHIIKIYDKSQNNGDFWYFDQYTSCGGDFDFTKVIPRLDITLRDANRNLLKNTDVSLYAFHADADGNATIDPQYLISSSRTGNDGSLTYYVSGNITQVADHTGTYVLTVKNNSQTFVFSNIKAGMSDKDYEYVLGGLNLTLKNAAGRALGNVSVNVYNQADGPSLGSRLTSVKTNAAGEVSFSFPSGIYALTVADDFGHENPFFNVVIGTGGLTDKTITTNATKIYLSSIAADPKGGTSRSLQIYSLTGSGGTYYKDRSVGSVSVTTKTDKIISLAAGPYLLLYENNNQEYGRAFMATNDAITVAFSLSAASAIDSDAGVSLKAPESTVTPATPSKPATKPATPKVTNKYKGYIVAVNTGGLWYIGNNGLRYRLDGSVSTYDTAKKLAAGITNSDLNKISVGLNGMYGADSDKDGLSDLMERALNTNANKADSDGDRYSDLTEVKSGYNPLGKGKPNINKTFANKQKGRLFIAVQGHGELWYVSPRDGKRYFLFDNTNIAAALGKIAVKISWSEIANLKQGN